MSSDESIVTPLDFDHAVKAAGGLVGVTSENRLILYGLYNQTRTGDCNTARPGRIDFSGKAKWDKWNSYRGMSETEAREKYVKLVNELMAAEPSEN